MAEKGLYLRFPGGKAKALTFSYDDGVKEDKRLAKLFLEKGLKCTFNLNSSLIPTTEEDNKARKHPKLTWNELNELFKSGLFEVACHSATHPLLTACTDSVVLDEVLFDRRALEGNFKRIVKGMAYPYGPTDDRIMALLKSAGIVYSRTVTSTRDFSIPNEWLKWNPTCHHNSPDMERLIAEFLAVKPNRDAKAFYIWGHSYEFTDNDNWSVIENIAEKLSGCDDIFYATNMEIYKAVENFRRLEFSADGKTVYNPCCEPVWAAKPNSEAFKIEAGQTVNL